MSFIRNFQQNLKLLEIDDITNYILHSDDTVMLGMEGLDIRKKIGQIHIEIEQIFKKKKLELILFRYRPNYHDCLYYSKEQKIIDYVKKDLFGEMFTVDVLNLYKEFNHKKKHKIKLAKDKHLFNEILFQCSTQFQWYIVDYFVLKPPTSGQIRFKWNLLNHQLSIQNDKIKMDGPSKFNLFLNRDGPFICNIIPIISDLCVLLFQILFGGNHENFDKKNIVIPTEKVFDLINIVMSISIIGSNHYFKKNNKMNVAFKLLKSAAKNSNQYVKKNDDESKLLNLTLEKKIERKIDLSGKLLQMTPSKITGTKCDECQTKCYLCKKTKVVGSFYLKLHKSLKKKRVFVCSKSCQKLIWNSKFQEK